MSIFSRVWIGDYMGHELKVLQQKGGQQHVLMIDGEVADEITSPDKKSERHLKAALNHKGQDFLVEVTAQEHALTDSLTLTVDGEEIPMNVS